VKCRKKEDFEKITFPWRAPPSIATQEDKLRDLFSTFDRSTTDLQMLDRLSAGASRSVRLAWTGLVVEKSTSISLASMVINEGAIVSKGRLSSQFFLFPALHIS
jgi:hypothetical protein